MHHSKLPKIKKGMVAEQIAIQFLLQKGFFVFKNLYGVGPADLIAINEISILSLAKKLIAISKLNKKIKKINFENFSVQRRLPDIKKLLKDTSYKKKSNFNENLKKTYYWYEKNLFI